MQVVETKNDGLSRELTVTVPADDIESRISARLAELARDIRVPGFRPGKVPTTLVRQRYGQAVRGEVLESAVVDSSAKALSDQGLRPAMQPKIEVKSFDEGKDLEYTIAVDILPEFEPVDFRTIELERLTADVTDDMVEDAVKRLASDYKRSEPIKEPRPAKTGDVLVIDFHGSIDGVAFPGGHGHDQNIELGSGQFIPGFEDQLIGAEAGAHVHVDVTFPEEYGAKELAGKAANFHVDVKEIREPVETVVDDEFAKSLGLEGLDQLRQHLRERMQQEYAGLSRSRLKRGLLDALADAHDFALPPTMVDQEFEAIWAQFEQAREAGQAGEDEAGKSDDELREEFRGIAERRVRLGLLLAEVGRRGNIQVTPEEVNRAMIQQVQRFPGQERQVLEYLQKNEQAQASLRAPIYEDKVVDYILEMAKVSSRAVPLDDLLRDPDEEPAGDEAADKKKAKKPAKKAAAKDDAKPAAKRGARKTAAKEADDADAS